MGDIPYHKTCPDLPVPEEEKITATAPNPSKKFGSSEVPAAAVIPHTTGEKTLPEKPIIEESSSPVTQMEAVALPPTERTVQPENILLEEASPSQAAPDRTVKAITRVIRPRPAIGIGMQEFTTVSISKVLPGSPAEKAGLQQGDTIIDFNGHPINKIYVMQDWVRSTSPGTEIIIFVKRNGKEIKLPLIITEMLIR